MVLGARLIVPAIGCAVFCVLYIFAIQPAVFYLFGFQRPDTGNILFIFTRLNVDYDSAKMRPHPQDHGYSQGYTGVSKKKPKSLGMIATILPFYAFGIFAYFAYTVVKLLGNRKKLNPAKKEEYLKEYYRNFRYVPEKGKFQMDSGSSGDEHGNGLRDFKSDYRMGWSSVPEDSDSAPDMYRSVRGLPKDLEYLLKKADEDNLDDAEITRLRTRLEQMEREMTHLLEVVNSSATFRSQTRIGGGGNESTSAMRMATGKETQYACPHHNDESDTLYSAEED